MCKLLQQIVKSWPQGSETNTHKEVRLLGEVRELTVRYVKDSGVFVRRIKPVLLPGTLRFLDGSEYGDALLVCFLSDGFISVRWCGVSALVSLSCLFVRGARALR